jgi:hypothetical protein
MESTIRAGFSKSPIRNDPMSAPVKPILRTSQATGHLFKSQVFSNPRDQLGLHIGWQKSIEKEQSSERQNDKGDKEADEKKQSVFQKHELPNVWPMHLWQ